jgi:vancomycin resistance protein YoaR
LRAAGISATICEINPATRELRTKALRILLVAIIAIDLLLILGFVAYESNYVDRIHVGVSALGSDLSGQTPAAARTTLAARLSQKQVVTLHDGSQRYLLTLAELGIQPDVETLVEGAFAVGRRAEWDANLAEQIAARLYGRSVSASLVLDEGAAQVALKRLARQIDREPRDASLALIGTQAISDGSQMGRTLDVAESIARITETIHKPGESELEVELAVRDVAPVVRDAGAAAEQLRAILASPMRLTLSEQAWSETGKSGGGMLLSPIQQQSEWTLDTAMLASLVGTRQVQGSGGQATLSVTFDDKKLTAFLKEIAAQIERQPRDARFIFDEKSGTLTPLIASQEGRTLDVPATLQRIKAQLAGGERTIALAVQTVQPTIALEDMEKFNIHELVVAGTTSFFGSSADRVKNIGAATNRFKGIVVAPGQEFSFDQFLGDVLDANGYEPAFVIVGDHTDVGIGGGICQVSTTAFRAAFFGGFKITQRWAHGYKVGYYEPPIGLDATVYAPLVDFRFVNDTANYLLIQPAVDLRNSTLTFNFYGTKNNRTVEMDGPTITKVIAHPPAIYENDPTLPTGIVKQVDFAADGMTVVVNRTVKEGDTILYKDRFASVYRPWQARFLVGTKKR